MTHRNPTKPSLMPAAFAIMACAFLHSEAPGQTEAADNAPADQPGQAGGSDEAIETLGLAAERFVEAFNKRDAPAIAALFMPQGEIRGRDGTIISGRDGIEDFYTTLFAGDTVPGVALEASGIHFITPEIAIEDGVVHFTYAEDEPVRSISYSATQVRQADGTWLTAISRDKLEVTPPSEQIKPLHWLIGEWTLEGDEGVRVDMVFQLDGRENYLLGEGLMTDPEGDAQSSSLRIGWNPATSSICWWNFDSEGGQTTGQWARNDNQWLIHNSGVTAENEATTSSQTLTREGADSMVWEASRRIVAGEILPDISFRFVRRAPGPGSKPNAAGD